MATPKSGISKPHQPTHDLRVEVSALTSFGHTQEQIASHLGISVDTLYKYYKDELENSVLRANAQVAKGLFKKATEDDNLAAMMFWLKTRARWRETDPQDISSNDQVSEDCKRRMKEQDDANKKPY